MNRSQAEKSLWVIVLSTSNRFKTDNMDLSDRIIYQSEIKLFQSSRRPSPILNYRRNRLKLKNDGWIRINLETIIPHTPVVHLDTFTKHLADGHISLFRRSSFFILWKRLHILNKVVCNLFLTIIDCYSYKIHDKTEIYTFQWNDLCKNTSILRILTWILDALFSFLNYRFNNNK